MERVMKELADFGKEALRNRSRTPVSRRQLRNHGDQAQQLALRRPAQPNPKGKGKGKGKGKKGRSGGKDHPCTFRVEQQWSEEVSSNKQRRRHTLRISTW